MTSLAGEFHTDLSPPDTLVACAEAIDGLGWRLEAVEAKRIVSYTDSERPAMIEVALRDPGEGTDLRIIGSDTKANPLNTEELVAELNRARDAIQEMVEEAEEAKASAVSKERGGLPRPQRRKMTSVIAIAAVGVWTAIGAALLWPDRDSDPDASNASHIEAPAPKPEPDPKRIAVDQQAAIPVEVEVPAVGISAPVVPLGLTDGGALEVPEDFSTAGWWASGPEPGERGAAVITAHVDSRAGPAAFYALADASPGDEVYVHRKDASTATFVIDRVGQYPKNDFPTRRVYDETPGPTLRLITCGGIFNDSIGHYRDNIVAYARRKPA